MKKIMNFVKNLYLFFRILLLLNWVEKMCWFCFFLIFCFFVEFNLSWYCEFIIYYLSNCNGFDF